MEKEDYLETIYELKKKLGHVRVSDVAKLLKLSKPSVTQMIQRLDQEGCVIYTSYAPLELTAKGKKRAKWVAERHQVLHEFFTVLGIPQGIQEKDIHGLEHYLSPITLNRLKSATAFLRKNKF